MQPATKKPAGWRFLPWLLAAAAAGAAAWVRYDYAAWRALGVGGLPPTPRGWLTMTRLRLQSRDGLYARGILQAIGKQGDLQAWQAVRPRTGIRPRCGAHPVPHRQLDQLPESAMRAELQELFHTAVRRHANTVRYAQSHFEKRNQAITLQHRSELDPIGGRSHGEIAHIHPSDSSMHMILSPTDASAAMRAGWAQRHGLAGIGMGLPATYMLVYGPRDHDDLGVIADLLEAAIFYMTQNVDSL